LVKVVGSVKPAVVLLQLPQHPQQANAQLTQHFSNNVITNLQRMTEETRGASQELAEQTQRAQEAARTLTQEATGAYMDFMNSLFAMSRGGMQRGAEETRRGS